MWGGKFDNRAPDLADAWGGIQRTNVLTQIEKLTRATDPLLHADYQVLCNVVHPSVGGTLSFSSVFFLHETSAYAWNLFTHFSTSVRQGEIVTIQAMVQESLVRTAVIAVAILVGTLDDALRLVDDVGLTTGAPALATRDYWRKIVPMGRNEPCPCRSGLKVKKCSHRWENPAPGIVDHFAPRAPEPAKA